MHLFVPVHLVDIFGVVGDKIKGTVTCLQFHGFMQFAFCCVVYPCLVLQYMGQAAFLSKNFSALPTSFYSSIPGKLLVSSICILWCYLLSLQAKFFALVFFCA